MFSSIENSFCKAISKLYASLAFLLYSALSTAFQRGMVTILGGALGENAKQVYLSGKSAEIVVKWFIFNTATNLNLYERYCRL